MLAHSGPKWFNSSARCKNPWQLYVWKNSPYKVGTHDIISPDYVSSAFSFSKSHPKERKASTDRYQRYLNRQEN